MPTITLQPNTRYTLTPDPLATLQRVVGAMELPAAGRLGVGDSIDVGDAQALFASEPCQIDVSGGSLVPWNGGTTALEGATPDLRRIVNAIIPTPPPALPTDGFSLQGADFLWFPVAVDAAGAVTVALWAFDDVSGQWDIYPSMGAIVCGASSFQRLGGPDIVTRGLSRFDVQVTVNGAGAQVDAWGICCKAA